MEVRPVSPLEINWDSDLPAYHVYFWKGSSAHEYELTGCHNVREAMAWADENAGADRSYTLYAVVVRDRQRGRVRLFGVEPTRHKGDEKLDWPGQVYMQDV
jgi:hypothetical protein